MGRRAAASQRLPQSSKGSTQPFENVSHTRPSDLPTGCTGACHARTDFDGCGNLWQILQAARIWV